MEQGKSIDELEVGDNASFSKTVTEADIILYAGITGDVNPLHIDEEYAKKSIFEGRVAHGGITMGLISAVLGDKLPGLGTIMLEMICKFKAPVRIGDTITARVEVTEKITEKNILKLKACCTNQDGTEVIMGEAVVMPPPRS
ncbi:MAG: MaoC family dehydratase [Deltaproteobacteria bacterium]|nr:MaoC family dehydratase [Deltaproteobacteria bacterium]